MSLKLNIFWGGQFYKIQCPQMASSITYENIFDFVDTGYETSGWYLWPMLRKLKTA